MGCLGRGTLVVFLLQTDRNIISTSPWREQFRGKYEHSVKFFSPELTDPERFASPARDRAFDPIDPIQGDW